MKKENKQMKSNFEAAYTELKELGAPVIEGGWNGEDTFRISGEDNGGDTIWADYYEELLPSSWEWGVNPIITETLSKHGLVAEWCNAGVLNVYESE